MPIDILLLLLAWAAVIGLIVVVPWAVIRLAVAVLEADVSMPGADREHARSDQPSDVSTGTAPSRASDELLEPGDGVSPPATPDADADGSDT